jgi:hypothetical protein
MEVAGSYETLVTIRRIARHRIPVHNALQKQYSLCKKASTMNRLNVTFSRIPLKAWMYVFFFA